MTKRKPSFNNTSFWQKTKNFLNSLLKQKVNKSSQQDDEGSGSGDSTSAGSGKLGVKKEGFLGTKATQSNTNQAEFVKEPETILYDELRKDPAAMLALKKLTNGQIPASEAYEAFEMIRNSEVALQSIANSEFAPSDVKAKAREELAKQQRKKLQAQPGFKHEPPKPRI